MKKSRYSQISDSEESIDVPESKNSFGANGVKNNRHSRAASNTSSDSKRIQEFQDNGSRSIDHKQLTTKHKDAVSSPLERFVLQNPDLINVKINNVISKDDEVCLLQVPKSVNLEQLMDKSIDLINFHERTKVKVDKTKYIIKPCPKDTEPLILLTNKLKIVHPVSKLKLQTYVKANSKSVVDDPGKSEFLLPNNLKVRHPLFGPEYKKKTVLDEEIQNKLISTIDKAAKKTKRKKKRKDSTKSEESIFTVLESHNFEKKKKKHKKKITDGDVANSESIFAFLESESFNSRRNEGDIFKKKTNKHNRTVVNSTVIPDVQLPNFELDISRITGQEMMGIDEKDQIKKKRKRRQSDDDGSGPGLKKKRKKDKEEQEKTDSLILDILNRVKSEIDNPVAKHKKRKKSES